MADTSARSFDLVERPWIMVHRLDGRVEEVSLLELFARAGEFRGVLGEIPTQTFAIMRLLLAILHRAVNGPPSADAWGALWRDDRLPVDDIADYLTHFRHRFDLLSPEMPFYQVADLRTAKEDVFGLERLIADVPTGSPFFTTRLGSGIERIGFAEAARWVVHCQAYDPSGIKSGAVGDDRVKGGKGYPIGTGWAGMLGGVLVEGRDLRETLLLHLIPDDADVVSFEEDDCPVWERPPHTAAEEVEGGREPTGPLDLYTWQSRRIRLFHDDDGVYGVLIANGDKLTPHNRHPIEPMSTWRRSRNQERIHGGTVYLPRAHDPERAIWRGLAALLEDATHDSQRKEAADLLRPSVLGWLGTARGALDDGYVIRTRAIGMEYGTQSATTTEVVDDAVSLSVVLLGEAGAELRATALQAVADAEVGAQALGTLAADLAEAAGGDGAGPRDRAREIAYARLDRPFRSWLAEIRPDTPPLAARAWWQTIARELIGRLGDELVAQAGPVAWRGREVDDRRRHVSTPEADRRRHVSTPEADRRFRRQLRRTYELAYTADKTEVMV